MQGQNVTTDLGNSGDHAGDNRSVAHERNGGAAAERQSKVALRTGGTIAGIIPTSIEEVFRLASAIAASGLAPRDMSTPEKLTVAILHGLEIGIPPMMAINKIAVVNGRPTLWGDAIPAILWSKGFKIIEHMGGGAETRCATCIIQRPDGTRIERNFSKSDAINAGLWGKQGPWKQYPDRMLQMRARGLAARDGAADVLSGIYLAEEAQDIVEHQPSNDILPPPPPTNGKRKSSAQAKRDGDNDLRLQISSDIASAETADDLVGVRKEYDAAWMHMPYAWVQLLEAEYQDRMQELTETTQAAE